MAFAKSSSSSQKLHDNMKVIDGYGIQSVFVPHHKGIHIKNLVHVDIGINAVNLIYFAQGEMWN